jgi:hypothetical protein
MTAEEATRKKRDDLELVIERFIEPEPAFKGVVAVGSVAAGRARAESDIDAIVYMDPVDRYVLPAESIWCPWDDTFHSIFTQDHRIQREGIHLDFMFRDLAVWSGPGFDWPEPERAGLAKGWIAFDRDGGIAELIRWKTTYDDATRLRRLDEFLLAADQELRNDKPLDTFQRFTPVVAHGRLDWVRRRLIGALFAYNRKWRPFRNREIAAVLQLDWLPDGFEDRYLRSAQSATRDEAVFAGAAEALDYLAGRLVERLVEEGTYGPDPYSDAFIRNHDEPGRAWNMDEWNRRRKRPGKV